MHSLSGAYFIIYYVATVCGIAHVCVFICVVDVCVFRLKTVLTFSQIKSRFMTRVAVSTAP